MSDHITASPLCWPEGWKRAASHKSSRFNKKRSSGWGSDNITIGQAVEFTLDELRKMGIPDVNVIISTDLKLRLDGLPYSNQKQPTDKGTAVWWKDGKEQRVIALDQYDRIADNIYAIGKTIEAMRGIERWGGGEILNRTFTGFTALPDLGEESWQSILEMGDLVISKENINSQFKKLAMKHHPDRGGDPEIFKKLGNARDQGIDDIEARR